MAFFRPFLSSYNLLTSAGSCGKESHSLTVYETEPPLLLVDTEEREAPFTGKLRKDSETKRQQQIRKGEGREKEYVKKQMGKKSA